MEINLLVVLAIIIIHWFADFLMQDEKWALGKSKNWSDLLSHTVTYSLVWLVIGIICEFTRMCLTLEVTKFNYLPILYFSLITFIAHTITDYFTSRIVSKKFANQQYGSPIPNFGGFTIIGIDQVLHYAQLFLTYYFLSNA